MKRFKSEQYMLIGVILIGFVVLAIAGTPESDEPRAETPVTTEMSEDETNLRDIRTSAKQAQYCYRINKHLPEPQLTEQIEICETQTSDWSLEQFEAEMPQ
jgi:hypothetical protein